MDQFVFIVETLLSFQSFLKYGCDLLLSRPGTGMDYDKALELFLRILVTTADRGEATNQWFLQKTLELTHFKMDILFMGPASGFSTETGERGLKSWAKQPSTTAQKRGDVIFSKQVCKRIHERVLINSIADCCPLEEEEKEVEQITGIVAKCANFVVEFGVITNIIRVLPSGGRHKHQIDFPEEVVSWFVKEYGRQQQCENIQLFTEAVAPKVTGDGGLLFRAHPNYRLEGAWYDYASAMYQENIEDDRLTSYPCKVVCFFVEPHTKEKMALVQEVEFQTNIQKGRESQLFEHWTLSSWEDRVSKSRQAILRAMPIKTLGNRLYVIDPHQNGGFNWPSNSDFEILVVKYSREQWPMSFLNSPEYFQKYRYE